MLLRLTLLCLATFLTRSQATSFYIRPFSEFTQSSPNIVRGTLSNIHAANSITSDGMKAIYTYASMDVSEVLKGDVNPHSIVIRKVGGTVDGYTVDIPSSPEFKDGEETVLFLSEKREDQAYEVLGLELGKFELEAKDGETVLKGGVFNYSKTNSEPGESLLSAPKPVEENQKIWTLKSLRALIEIQKSAQTSASTIKSPAHASESNPTPSLVGTQTATQTSTPLSAVDFPSPAPKTETLRLTLLLGLGASILAAGLYFLIKRKQA